MTLAVASMVIALAGLAAYAVLAGADFGAGVWDLTAGGAERGGRVRGMVQRSMSPVWEANHVWLILVHRGALDRVPGGVRLDLLDAVHPAVRRRHRDHLPRRRVRAPRPGGHHRRGARPGRRRSRWRRCWCPSSWARRWAGSPPAGCRWATPTGDAWSSWLNADVADRRRAGRADRRVPGGRVHGRRLGARGRARHGAGLPRPRAGRRRAGRGRGHRRAARAGRRRPRPLRRPDRRLRAGVRDRLRGLRRGHPGAGVRLALRAARGSRPPPRWWPWSPAGAPRRARTCCRAS